MYSMMLAEKLERNKKRYPVHAVNGNGKKYPEFGMSTLKRPIFIRTVDSPVTPYLFSSL